MLIVLTLIAFILIFISYSKYHKLFNPCSVILIWYFLLGWLSKIGIQEMYIPSDESTALILGNTIFIAIIFLALTPNGCVRLTEISRNEARETDARLLNDRMWFYNVRKICEIICFIIICAIDLNILFKLSTGAITASQIRYALIFQEASSSFNTDFLYFNGYVRDFLTYFVRFFVFFDVLIELSNFGLYNKPLRIIPMANFGLFCIAMLSRIDILKISIIICIVFLFIREKNDRKKMSKKNKTILLVAVILSLIVIVMRVYEGDNIIDFTIRNLSGSLIGPFEAFSIFFERYKSSGPIVSFAAVRMFFSGVTAVIEAFLVNGLKLNIPFVVKLVNAPLGDVIYVGPGQTFNAFYTMYYDFLAGGGILGTFVGAFLAGSTLALSYNKFQKHPSVSTCLLFVLWEYIILFGTIQWRGGLTEWACVFLVLIGNRIVVGKEKKIS